MNRIEHLYTCLIEEAGEVIQAVTKINRFSAEDHYPRNPQSNLDHLLEELDHLEAVRQMLAAEVKGFRPHFNKQIIMEKKKRVEDWMKYAKTKGTLNEKE